MRLTLDVIGSAEQNVGPLKERILSLRGLKIPVIENLGATNDHFDTFDLCDNDLIKLDSFPPLKRLETLLVANNRIMRLDPDAFHNLPALKSLILTNNKLRHLSDLTPLAKAKRLERLSLVDNPVTSRQHYRAFLIHSIPSLRFLDFQHIKDAERLEAKKLFSGSQGAALLNSIAKTHLEQRDSKANGAEASLAEIEQKESPTATLNHVTQAEDQKALSTNQNPAAPSLTSAEIAGLQDAIASATSLAEVQLLEQALETGILPSELKTRLNI